MEGPPAEIVDEAHITRDSGNEKNDVYNLINTCREKNKVIEEAQLARFLARLKVEANLSLFLSEIGPYVQGVTVDGLKACMNSCKYNKGKRAVVERMAALLPADTTDEQKEEIADVITANFEKNKAKKALGI